MKLWMKLRMKLRTRRTRRPRGYTLIEMMITVAIIGIGTASAWSVWGMFDAPDRPGHAAISQDHATQVLVAAHQQALATPLLDQVGKGALPQPSAHPAIRLTRSVSQAEPGLLHIEWTARWPGRGAVMHARQLTALKRVTPAKAAP